MPRQGDCSFSCLYGKPYCSFGQLNGFLIGRSLDLDAKPTIDELRQLFAQASVESDYSGDLEEVVTLMGMSESRSRSIAQAKRRALIALREMRLVLPSENDYEDSGACYDIIDYYQTLYGSDKSIVGESKLDGFFAAIAYVPNPVRQATWTTKIFGSGMPAPALQNSTGLKHFNLAVLSLYQQVVADLKQGRYEPEFIYHAHHYENLPIVDEWCEGFIRGPELWDGFLIEDNEKLQEWIQPMQRFGADPGIQSLDALRREEFTNLKDEIVFNLSKIYHLIPGKHQVAN